MSELAAPRNRLAFALDYPDLDAARRGAEHVAGSVGVLKVGLELFVKAGPDAVRVADGLDCGVFLDLKLHDIPATVERAVATAAGLGVRYLTIHAAGGPSMVEAAVRRASRESDDLTVLAVTVLTSMDAADLEAIGVGGTPESQVLRLASLARDAGAGGLVCSMREAGALREALGNEIVLVTPGIRPASGEVGDQKRVGTPTDAIRAGADILVVGRPIRDAPDPASAASAILSEIAQAGDGHR